MIVNFLLSKVAIPIRRLPDQSCCSRPYKGRWQWQAEPFHRQRIEFAVLLISARIALTLSCNFFHPCSGR